MAGGFFPEGLFPEGYFPEGYFPDDSEGEVERVEIDVSGGYVAVKTAAETAFLTFDWSSELSDGVTLASVTHDVDLPLVIGNEVTDTLEGTSDIDVSGGLHGYTYSISIAATLSNGQTVTRTWPLRIFG